MSDAKQYYKISPTIISLKELCGNKCEAMMEDKNSITWVFEDGSRLKLEYNQYINIDERYYVR